MDDVEARVRCIEVAATLNARTGDHSAESVVNTARVLYNFTQTPLPEETQVIPADKPKQKKTGAKALDILS